MATYKIQQGDTLSSIAARNNTTADAIMKANPTITDPNKIYAGSTLNIADAAPAAPVNPTPTVTPVTSPVPAPTPTATPTLPVPQAPTTHENFMASGATQLDNTRKTLETGYKTQLDQIQAKRDEAQKNVDQLTADQGNLIDTNIGPLLEPFRQTLETTQREALHVNANFEANQALTEELSSLLTEGNNLVKQQKGLPLSMSVINKTTTKTMSDIAARAGVIQAVMSARNGQISTAETMIDRSVAAVTADRKDQLDFYKTVYDFYEGQKTDENKKITSLDSEKATFVKAQIGLLEHDMTQAEDNANNIKKLMQDPDKAMFMAKAGVTLNDTPEQVNAKMAKQAQVEAVAKEKNDLTEKGYTYVPFPAKGQAVKYFDIGGEKLAFTPPPVKKSSSNLTVSLTPENKRDLAGIGMSSSDISDVENSVDDFGIKATLQAITDPTQRAKVAEVYGATDILDQIDTAASGGTDTSKPWWKFW